MADGSHPSSWGGRRDHAALRVLGVLADGQEGLARSIERQYPAVVDLAMCRSHVASPNQAADSQVAEHQQADGAEHGPSRVHRMGFLR